MLHKRIVKMQRLPKEVREAFYNADGDDEAENGMFRDIIARAVLDAVGTTGLEDRSERSQAVMDARVWFKGENPYREAIFSLAGVEPQAVINYVRGLPPYDYVTG